jgi:peptidoglycan/xylan/chitin deacetylase (PgdA/CDA1 family)
VIALMYHDVVEPGADDASGFPGKDAALYKVSPQLFTDHLRAVIDAVLRGNARPVLPAITFDDGGVSAMRAADLLERYGLRGHFFVTANYIGMRGFVDRRDMTELADRGHIVGSHSCSHPLRMGHCDPPQLCDEWTRSRDIIESVLGRAVTLASVPGGDFAPAVADAAAHAGFAGLFTSEPTIVDRQMNGLTLHGRFTIRRWTTAGTAAALATGEFAPRAAQMLAWNLRKAGKRLAGDRYLQLRQWLLRQPADVRWGDAPRRRPVRD